MSSAVAIVQQRIARVIDRHGPQGAADLERRLKLTKGRVWYALKHGEFSQRRGALWAKRKGKR